MVRITVYYKRIRTLFLYIFAKGESTDVVRSELGECEDLDFSNNSGMILLSLTWASPCIAWPAFFWSSFASLSSDSLIPCHYSCLQLHASLTRLTARSPFRPRTPLTVWKYFWKITGVSYCCMGPCTYVSRRGRGLPNPDQRKGGDGNVHHILHIYGLKP